MYFFEVSPKKEKMSDSQNIRELADSRIFMFNKLKDSANVFTDVSGFNETIEGRLERLFNLIQQNKTDLEAKIDTVKNDLEVKIDKCNTNVVLLEEKLSVRRKNKYIEDREGKIHFYLV
jgi:hypothetical protein